MKILFIAPASGKWRHVARNWPFNGKTFRFSMLSLLSVAAETPAGHEVRLIDEQVDSIPWHEDFDLVGITFMTALAPRAYEIADRFRERGIPVVTGGMHSTFLQEEALQHADAVVCGQAEGIWPKVLENAESGSMKGIYRNEQPPDLAKMNPIPNHLLPKSRYSTYAVQATRGCPNRCSFCAVSAFHDHKQYRRPIDDVIREVVKIPSSHFIFVDDHLTADRFYAKELFQKLIPLKKKWITQSTLDIAEDTELVRFAAESGCIGLFVGLETFSDSNLESVEKNCNRNDRYRESIRILHAHGIGVEAGIVFGFDGDDASVFSTTLKMLDDLEIDAIQASIFTPLPGVKQFQTMQHRILDRNWAHYDFHHVVFDPRRMTAEALQAGHDWVTHEFYKPWRIARRLARHAKRPNGLQTMPFVAGINMAYYGRTRSWHIRGWNPEEKDAVQGVSANGHLAQVGISSIRPVA